HDVADGVDELQRRVGGGAGLHRVRHRVLWVRVLDAAVIAHHKEPDRRGVGDAHLRGPGPAALSRGEGLQASFGMTGVLELISGIEPGWKSDATRHYATSFMLVSPAVRDGSTGRMADPFDEF